VRGRRGAALLVALLFMAAVLVVGLGRRHGAVCHSHAPHGAGGAWLRQALSDVPCPGAGAVAYAVTDDQHAPMDVLDPIADPRGGYLGVYHTPLGRTGAAAQRFEILLAHSADLIHWHRLRVLERGASMPTLRPAGGGYVLADEHSGVHNTVEVHWYRSLAAVLAGAPTENVGLPLRYSRAGDGTPAIVQTAWNGSPSRSQIVLSFHYQSAAGPDREAFGVLTGFRRWATRRDSATDALLDREGYLGNHGDERWFAFAGQTWRILEAESRPASFASWHVLLYDPAGRRFAPVTFNTLRGRFGASFGNPTAQLLPAPGGRGQVLAVTAFVFGEGPAASEAGELVFLRPAP
jgi:hypothetical protein